LSYILTIFPLPPLSPFPFLSLLPPPPPSTLFPYTTLFRSSSSAQFAGSRPAVPPPCPSPPAAEGDPEPLEGKGLVERGGRAAIRSEEHTSELQSPYDLVCRLLLEKKKKKKKKKLF